MRRTAALHRPRFWQAAAPFAIAASMSLALVLFAMTPARAGNGAAEAFVQSLIDEGLTILRDTDIGLAARRARFHQLVVRNADARTTALFALGRYRRGLSESDLERYVAAFRDYVSALYEIRLEERKDANLRVTASVDNKANDVTVTTEAIDPKVKEPVKIAFRLIGAGGPLKVVDVQVAGVWISVEQRDQFAAILSKSNGDVAALVSHLIAQTARMRSREQPA